MKEEKDQIKQIDEDHIYRKSSALTQSDITLARRSIPRLKKRLDGEEEEEKDDTRKSVGTINHKLMFEPESFSAGYKVITGKAPSHKTHKSFVDELLLQSFDTIDTQDMVDAYMNNYSTKGKSKEKIEQEATELFKKYEGYIKEVSEGSDRVLVNKDDYDVAQESMDTLFKHPTLGPLLRQKTEPSIEVFNEQIVFFTLDGKEQNGFQQLLDNNSEDMFANLRSFLKEGNSILLGAKLDKVIVDHSIKHVKVIDGKNIARSFHNFHQRFDEYDMDIQPAMYTVAVTELLSNQKEITDATYTTSFNYAVVDTRVMEARSFGVGWETLKKGLTKILSTLDDYVWHLTNDKWECFKEEYEKGGIII